MLRQKLLLLLVCLALTACGGGGGGDGSSTVVAGEVWPANYDLSGSPREAPPSMGALEI